MNYKYQYYKIINIAKDQYRSKNDGNYYENHHIIPKCLGGTNDDNNMILLTAREHYVVHKLLCRIYPKNRSLYYALHMMSICSSKNQKRDYVVSSRDYQWLRENKPDSWNKGKIGMCPQLSHDRNKGENNPMYGSNLSDEHKKKMTEGRKLYWKVEKILHPNVILPKDKKSIEEKKYDFLIYQRERRREYRKNNPLPPRYVSDETRKKISETLKKRNEDPEYRRMISERTKEGMNKPEVRERIRQGMMKF